MRRTEPRESRHQVDAAVVGLACGQCLDLARRVHQAQPVAQPLHHRAGNEHAAFKRIANLGARSPRHGGQKPVVRLPRAVARVQQDEAAGDGHGDVVAGDGPRLAIGAELADAGTEHDGTGECRYATDGVAPAAFAGECEDNFSKSGSIFSGTDFSSRVTVPDLSVKDAMGQTSIQIIDAEPGAKKQF